MLAFDSTTLPMHPCNMLQKQKKEIHVRKINVKFKRQMSHTEMLKSKHKGYRLSGLGD